jgi:hypothetical protein
MRFINLRKLIAETLMLSMSSLTIGNFAAPASASPVAIGIGITSLGVGIANLVRSVQGDDNKKRSEFTKRMIKELNEKYPEYNAVIAREGSVEGDHVIEKYVELQLATTKCGYKIYLSPKGKYFKFVRHGDGDFINWAYGGEFKRDDNVLTAN